MKDLLISVDCDYTYHVRSRDQQTDYNYIDYEDPKSIDPKTKKPINYLQKALKVHPETCEPYYDLERWTQVRHYPAGETMPDYDKFAEATEYTMGEHTKQKWDRQGNPLNDIKAWAKKFEF